MERDALEQLRAWKGKKRRKPLIVEGARQVGKTWLLKEFGRTCYGQVAYVNFEEQKHLRTLLQKTLMWIESCWPSVLRRKWRVSRARR